MNDHKFYKTVILIFVIASAILTESIILAEEYVGPQGKKYDFTGLRKKSETDASVEQKLTEAGSYFEHGNFDEVVKTLTEVIRISPNNLGAYSAQCYS